MELSFLFVVSRSKDSNRNMYVLAVQTLLHEIKHKAMQVTLVHFCVGGAAGANVNVVIFTVFRAIRVRITVTRKSHTTLCLSPSLMHLKLT
jgi:hypothetical protein